MHLGDAAVAGGEDLGVWGRREGMGWGEWMSVWRGSKRPHATAGTGWNVGMVGGWVDVGLCECGARVRSGMHAPVGPSSAPGTA